MTIKKLTKLEKLKFIGMIVKAAAGTLGAGAILSEEHPYFAIIVLAIGAMSNEALEFLKERERTPDV
ncbi:MAG TPA: hypothetical protein VMV86_02450 [Methanosarcinales archaeon]|nr:hypothetical protein [Methanosarcinales archaeon]